MAERLLTALGKGAAKAAAEQASSASRAALDVVSFRNLYRAGIVGPLLQSIVSEYKKSEEKSKTGKSNQQSADTKVITSNISISLKNMSSQLSAIADIMEDIRDLTKNQIQLDKDAFRKQQQQIRSSQAASIEEKLEAVKPSTAGLMGMMRGQTEKQLGPVGKAVSGILGFAKENPILSAIIGAGLIASSSQIQGFIKEFREKSGIDKDIKNAVSSIATSVGGAIVDSFNTVKKDLIDYINQYLPSFMKISTSKTDEKAAPDVAEQVGKAALGYGIGRFFGGRLGGLTGAVYGGTEASFGESLLGGAGILAGGALLGKGLKAGGGAAMDKLGQGLKAGGGAASDALKRMLRIGGPAAAAASTAGISATVPPEPDSKVVIGDYTKGRDELAREARQLERQNSKTTISGLVKRIKKLGFKRAATFLASRAAVGLAGFATGPIGIITTLLAVGYTLYQVSELLDEFEKAVAESITGVAKVDTESFTGSGAQPVTPASSLAEPVQVGTSFNYEEYKQRVMQLESQGQNIQNQTGSRAFGLYQIMPDTFETIKRNNPSLKNVSWEDFKSDTAIQEKVFDLNTASNAKDLEKAGLAANAFNLYLAHRMGSAAAIRLLKADPSKDVIKTGYTSFKEQNLVFQQNPDLRNKTVGQFLAERAAAFGGAGGVVGPNPLPFTPSAATADSILMDKIGDITGLSAFNKAAELIRPIIVDQSKTTGSQSSRPTTPPSSPTIPASQQSKHELRSLLDPNTNWMYAP